MKIVHLNWFLIGAVYIWVTVAPKFREEWMGVGLWNFEILKPQGETRSHAQSCLLLKVVLKSETKFTAFTKVDSSGKNECF